MESLEVAKNMLRHCNKLSIINNCKQKKNMLNSIHWFDCCQTHQSTVYASKTHKYYLELVIHSVVLITYTFVIEGSGFRCYCHLLLLIEV